MSSHSPQHAPAGSARTVPEPALAERLHALRAELDGIDDALHDGLMRRAELVAQVAALGAKGQVPLRPGREASILRRLLARNHGALAPATVVRVWRELLAGSSAQQNRMTVAVGAPGLLDLTREHFGALAPTLSLDTAAAVERLRQGLVSVAVAPWPGPAEQWWAIVLRERWPGVHVVARLPFWGRDNGAEAAVLSAAAPDPSGSDRSLLGAAVPDAPAGGAGAALRRVLEAAGFEVGSVAAADGSPFGLADVAGFVTPEDIRLRRAGLATPPVVLGAYAIPVGDFA